VELAVLVAVVEQLMDQARPQEALVIRHQHLHHKEIMVALRITEMEIALI
jgi:hypothetical protein